MTNTLNPFIVRYISERRQRGEISRRTAVDLDSRLRTLSESFGRRSLNRFTEPAIDQWLGTIGGMRASSRRSYLSTVKRFSHWMVRRGHLTIDPTDETARIREPRSVPRALPVEKIGRLLEANPQSRRQLVLWLMIGLGLRCCEVAWIRVDDYDPVARTLFIRGKSSHERVLPVPDILAGAIHYYLDEVGWRSGPMVKSELEPILGLLPSTISTLVSDWMIEAGVKHHKGDGISAHALRHTCASDVLDRCGDLRVVQALLGHANIATTSRYLRIAGLDQIRDAVEGRTYRDKEAA